MAPVEIVQEPSFLPLALAVSRVAATVYLSYTVGSSLYQAHTALGPAQDTRHRLSKRSTLTTAFGSLAALGLASAITSSLKYLTLSYKVWASERGVAFPDSLSETQVSGADGAHSTGLFLQYWLNDTPIYLDALEIIAEKSRRLWWGQQLDLATIAWTALLAVEGRRRRIPHLWAYALLPHLVSLSFAQNLFYVALLQAPTPIPSQETRIAQAVHRILPRKPNNWFPKLAVLLVPLALSYLATLWLPNTAGTSLFPTAVLASKLLTLAPLVLPALAPASWGAVHTNPRGAYRGITKLFNVISIASALFHAKTTVSSLLYNLPDSYKHRHSIKIPFDTEQRSKWERTATAVEKVLGSMADHPVVAAAGKDVLLCALSLGLWAAVRGLDVSNMLRSAAPICQSASEHDQQAAPSQGAEHSDQEGPSPSSSSSPSASPATTTTRTLRKRGSPARTPVSAATVPIDGPGDGPAQATPKRRGRPRKTKPAPETEVEEAKEIDEAPDDKTFEPTPAVKAEAAAAAGDVLPEEDFDWEPASLAWGLTALAGLGAGSAAVFGAECVSR